MTIAAIEDTISAIVPNAMRPRSELLRQGHDAEALFSATRHKATPPAIGDLGTFWLGDMGAVGQEISATLMARSAHIQMWVDTNIQLEGHAIKDLERSAQAFDTRIRASNHEHFGSEWSPGIDGDPQLIVLNAVISGAAGYFTASNEYPKAILSRSNEREMFVMNIGALSPGTDAYDSVLTHEFQHMIHWHQDSTEAAWLNEGMSELAEDLAGYGHSAGSIGAFARNPDMQLNAWTDVPSEVGAHYGASYLLMRYLWERYGSDMIRELVSEPTDGIASIDAVLRRHGHAGGFEALFADWLIANLLDDPTLQDGRYGYAGVDLAILPEPIEPRHVVAPVRSQVHPYGADYYEITSPQPLSLHIAFEGDAQTKVIPNEPAGGRYQWWSNRGDASYSSLIGRFDLTAVTSATLSYDTWYDIEPGWDYGYLRASRDGGTRWEIVQTPHAVSFDPNGNALGVGYTGRSALDSVDPGSAPAWVHEVVDLSGYTGGEVWLRFDYVTDDAVNYAGFCLDNIEMAAIGFSDDVETASDAWEPRGFVRLDNHLAQRYVVQVVEFGAGEPRIKRMAVDLKSHGEYLIEGLEDGVSRIVLIVSATTPGTRESAHYALSIGGREGTWDIK